MTSKLSLSYRSTVSMAGICPVWITLCSWIHELQKLVRTTVHQVNHLWRFGFKCCPVSSCSMTAIQAENINCMRDHGTSIWNSQSTLIQVWIQYLSIVDVSICPTHNSLLVWHRYQYLSDIHVNISLTHNSVFCLTQMSILVWHIIQYFVWCRCQY